MDLFLGVFLFWMGASHAPCYINVTKHGNFPLSDGTFGTALALLERPKGAMEQRAALLERPQGAMEQRSALLERPKGAWNSACATGTPAGQLERRSALLERPGGAYALRQARFPALVRGLEGGIGLGLNGEAAGERSESIVRTSV